jgi:hypothetical protein
MDSFTSSIKSVNKEHLNDIWLDALMAANIPFKAMEHPMVKQAVYLTQVSTNSWTCFTQFR